MKKKKSGADKLFELFEGYLEFLFSIIYYLIVIASIGFFIFIIFFILSLIGS